MRLAKKSIQRSQPATSGSPWGVSRHSCQLTTISRLHRRFAQGGLLHYGQGKWYPGELLPRWAFSLIWRRDGVPVWRNADLIERETAQRKLGLDDARRLIEGIAERLGLLPDYIQSAFEDPAEHM